MPAQAAGSSIQLGITMTTPGAASTKLSRAAGPDLAVMQPKAPAVQRVPAIMNLDFSPDTGRMNGRWPSAQEVVAVRRLRARRPSAPPLMYTLIETARLNDVDPQAWLADVLARIADHPAHRLDELLPWNWRPPIEAVSAKAA